MDILIKGLGMPQKCSECLLAKLSPTGESLICNYMLSRVPWDERPFDCPLVPVPPHGRLIDADDTENIILVMNDNGIGFKRIIAPIIIEAEVDDEDKTM